MMKRHGSVRFLVFAALLAVVATVGTALAHPHVFVTSKSQIVFNGDGAITEIRHVWEFDLPFSIYAVEGLDANGDGRYSDEELQPLAKVNAESLKEFDFFTFVFSGNDEPPYAAPKDYHLERSVNGELTLHYTLPLETPYDARNKRVDIDIYDPEYFVAFKLAETNTAELINAPDDCSLKVQRPKPMDAEAQAKLSELPAEMRDLPEEYLGLVSDIENKLIVTCGTVVATAAPAPREIKPSGTPFGVAPVEQGFNPNEGGLFSGFLGWVAAQQSRFYQMVTAAVTETRTNPMAAFTVLAFAFIYGVLHAAGPGHGKAVISSYVLANRETARRGALIAFLAAMLQAVSAITIVGVMTLILRMTSASMTRASGILELLSYVLIIAIGAWLVWRAVGLRPQAVMATAGAGGPVPHHGHDHVHLADGSCCGHTHAPDIDDMAQPLSWKAAWGAIMAVGIRPCSGALILLVFCFAQGMFALGIAGTVAMAVGTGGITAAIATSALGARNLVERLSRSPETAATIAFAIELGAGAFVLLFGLVFFAGALVRNGLV
ncbi:DUF1007 family protein [Tepidamorphus sp. 3E244]|uniref:HoxN/HupN/NixA family nickel/cobalt transporter n=1 Tax=Tepidamorphus sp. 3E244 TaxID=3385498 RepID=UPI0038FCCC4A